MASRDPGLRKEEGEEEGLPIHHDGSDANKTAHLTEVEEYDIERVEKVYRYVSHPVSQIK